MYQEHYTIILYPTSISTYYGIDIKGCETPCPTLREEQRLTVFEDRALRKKFDGDSWRKETTWNEVGD
jgi:hypothetical protein